MASNNKTDKTTDVIEETTEVKESKYDLVEVFIPKGNINDEPNLFVGVNGKSFLLPKGKKSKVPRYIAAEIERSNRAQEIADEHIEEMLEATKKPVSVK